MRIFGLDESVAAKVVRLPTAALLLLLCSCLSAVPRTTARVLDENEFQASVEAGAMGVRRDLMMTDSGTALMAWPSLTAGVRAGVGGGAEFALYLGSDAGVELEIKEELLQRPGFAVALAPSFGTIYSSSALQLRALVDASLGGRALLVTQASAGLALGYKDRDVSPLLGLGAAVHIPVSDAFSLQPGVGLTMLPAVDTWSGSDKAIWIPSAGLGFLLGKQVR